MGRFEEGHSRVCFQVSKLPKSKSRTSKVRWLTTTNPNFYLEVRRHQYGFFSGFASDSKLYDSIWVVVDRLTKSARFISIKSTYLAEYYARIFIDQIVRRHGVLLSFISDWRTQFTSRVWRSFEKGLGTRVKLSTT